MTAHQHVEQQLASALVSMDEYRQQVLQLKDELERLKQDQAGARGFTPRASVPPACALTPRGLPGRAPKRAPGGTDMVAALDIAKRDRSEYRVQLIQVMRQRPGLTALAEALAEPDALREFRRKWAAKRMQHAYRRHLQARRAKQVRTRALSHQHIDGAVCMLTMAGSRRDP